ncbi:MAG: GNAT family N-acetyltransferase [Actinomycetota bacterium]|nr:GNAT family N-acetyltransferase [Actinomycetota bacterium]
MEIRELEDAHRSWATGLVAERFGSPRIVSRARLHDSSSLPGLVAFIDGKPTGLLQYRIDGAECEIVVLVATTRRCGIGTALLDSLSELAREAGCRRIWLVTTNDNRTAQDFYRKRGWAQSAVYPGAVRDARILKPEIPLIGEQGIPVEDEIEFECVVSRV